MAEVSGAVIGAVFVVVALLWGYFSGMIASPIWHFRARDGQIPVGERKVTLPARPETNDWTAATTGYRGVQYVRPRRRGAVSLDPSRDRGPDVRVLPGNRALAVRIKAGRAYVLVRIEAAREGEDVVARAFACTPDEQHADWREQVTRTLAPFMDSLLQEMTGLRPVEVWKARVDIETDEDEPQERRATHRRGWPKD